MNIYKVYVLIDEELKLVDVLFSSTELNKIINREANKHMFFIINSYKQNEEEQCGLEFMASTIYLGFNKLRRIKSREATVRDIQNIIPSLAKIYRADGSADYLPDSPLSVQDVLDITGGWYSIKIVKEKPQRYAIVFFDTKQHNIDKMPKYNKQASDEFGVDLYGDVLYICENFIS